MEEMDVLKYLKSRQNELERVNHPFINRNLNFRYLYSYGVGVLAVGNMKSMSELSERFEYFMECIALPKEQREQIIVDINNHFEFRLTECIKILKTKEVQYCFLIDLYLLYNRAEWSTEYCKKVIANYLEIFHTSEPEIAFFKEFNDAAVKRDERRARDYYHRFRDMGFDISYKMLRYFFPEFTDADEYQDVTVLAGKTFWLDKPTKILGDIRVERGGSLLINGADITINGAVLVDGGRIRLKNTKLYIEHCERDSFLTVRDAAVVRIENAVIDCNGQCGFLKQKSGRLLIEETEFLRSDKKRMVEFYGTYAEFLRCSFSEGEQGFILAGGSSQMKLLNCDFFHAAAEYGGAVFSDSIDDITIKECSFRSCTAKYLGAAVYFKNLKLGQIVKDCVCRECYPKENAVFNAYGDDFDFKIR